MGGIIWLASYPKSGNTWLRSFLYNLLRNTPKPADINELDQFCLGESSAQWYERHLQTPVEDASPEVVMKIRPFAHADMTQAFPDSVFVKTHNFLGEWHGMPMHNMDVTAGGIYVVRNPLDVVLSMTHHFGLTLDEAIERLGNKGAATSSGGGHVPEFHSSWSAHVKKGAESAGGEGGLQGTLGTCQGLLPFGQGGAVARRTDARSGAADYRSA